jgi:hypothetical protein
MQLCWILWIPVIDDGRIKKWGYWDSTVDIWANGDPINVIYGLFSQLFFGSTVDIII